MAINLNKGGSLGKYFYLNKGVEYGPVQLSDLLVEINKDTLVYFEGIQWTKASEIPELKKYFITEERVIEKVVDRVIEPIAFEPEKPKRNIFIPILLVSILIGGIYWYYDSKERSLLDEYQRQQKAELDSVGAMNAMLLAAAEQQRIHDSVISASTAMLDSAKLIKLSIDYSIGVERVKELLRGYYNNMSSRSSSMSSFFADTIYTYFTNSRLTVQELEKGLNDYFTTNTNISEQFTLQDSTCFFDSMDGIYGVYKFQLYYKNEDNSSSENQSVFYNISASIKINPNFKIVYYTWDKREPIDASSDN